MNIFRDKNNFVIKCVFVGYVIFFYFFCGIVDSYVVCCRLYRYEKDLVKKCLKIFMKYIRLKSDFR